MQNSVHTLQPTSSHPLVTAQHHIYHSIARASKDAMLIAAFPVPPSPHTATSELRISFVNDAFCELIGYSTEELTGQPLTFLTKCTATTSTLAPLWQALDQEQPAKLSWCCLTKDGEQRSADLSLVPLSEGPGVTSYLLVINGFSTAKPATPLESTFPTDIQRFIDSLQVGITLLDHSKRVVAVNRYARQRLKDRFGVELIIGAPLIPPALELLGEDFDLFFDSAIKGTYRQSLLPTPITMHDLRWYSMAYTPLRNDHDEVQYVALIANDITTNKETEDALALSLQRYALAAKNAKSGIWDWDLQTGSLYIDSSAKALLGYGDGEFESNLGLWISIVHPDDHDFVVAATEAHLAGKSDELRVEYRVRHKDGSYRWMAVAAKASCDAANRPLRVIGTSVDITERKTVEAELHRSEGRFQAVWEATPDAMVLLDETGCVMLANPAYSALLGNNQSEVIDRPFELILPPEYDKSAQSSYLALLETGIIPKQQIKKFQAADSVWKAVEISTEFVRQAGEPVAMFSTMRDITARNETEATLKRHARLAETLTQCSQLLLKPVLDEESQIDCLQATLSTLRRGLEADYLAYCAPTAAITIEVVAPHFREEKQTELNKSAGAAIHLADSLIRRLEDVNRTIASSDEVTTGLLPGSFNTFHVERLTTSAGRRSYIIFGARCEQSQWKPEELWFIQTAVEMIEHVLLRWEAKEAVSAAHATLEQQVQQRTAMLFQTVESLQRQIRQRMRAEQEVRRRLNVERALRDISARLMRETNFNQAAAATLADIGEKLAAAKLILLRLQPEGDTFTGSHSWVRPGVESPSRLIKLATNDFPRLLKHLRKVGYLLVNKPLSAGAGEFVEIGPFQEWFSESMLLLPLNVSDELVGLLVCCDAELLREEREEGLHFVQAAVGMLSAMLRIDQMMNALEKRVAEQTEELAAFFNMAVLASGSEHVTETLAAALTMVREIGNCDAVCVHILSPDGASLQLAYQVGLDNVDHRHLLRLPRESTLYQRIQRTSTPILITELNPAKLEAHLDEFQTFLGAPMVVRSNVQGLLSCYWRFVHSVSLNQMSLLTALTDQLGIILENQRLHRHAQEAGVVHERQRLARELHDSVTQSMYGAMIFARAGREALEDNAFERLADCLAQVEGAALRSLKEMRLLLYQLRPLALESQGVVEAIRNRLEMVEHRLGIEVDMQMTPIVGLSNTVEEALYHIAMEALNNVLKHADADRVAVQLQLAGDQAELSVSDDGVGFELEQVTHGMGLNNMRERVAALNGDLQINTRVDAGTTITVHIPVA